MNLTEVLVEPIESVDNYGSRLRWKRMIARRGAVKRAGHLGRRFGSDRTRFGGMKVQRSEQSEMLIGDNHHDILAPPDNALLGRTQSDGFARERF